MNHDSWIRRAGIALLLLTPGPAAAQAGASWIEAGGFYHQVGNDFGSWKGGYARAVLSGSRDVWYLEARGQEAFRDRGLYGSLSNVHTFSRRFYTQAGVGGGTGDYVLPDLRADASLNLKLGPTGSLIATAGGTWVEAKQGFRDRAVFGSLTWYARSSVLIEAGGRVNWSDPDRVRSARASAALTLGRTGSALVTLRGSAGTEGYQLTGAAATLQKFRSQEASASLRRWITTRLGVVIGAEWYHNPSYTRAGAALGVFRAW